MGSIYPVLSSREVIRALRRAGFEEVSQRGSHRKLKNDADPPQTVIVPMHDEIAREPCGAFWNNPALIWRHLRHYSNRLFTILFP